MNSTPFRERRTWLIGVRNVCDWQMKVYGICADGCELESTTIEAALQYAARHVDWPDHVPRFGFVTLHAGEEAVWLLVDVWVDDILRHFLFHAPVYAPDQFQEGPADGTMACVWELPIIARERNAWVRHVMSQTGPPDYDAYTGDSLNSVAC